MQPKDLAFLVMILLVCVLFPPMMGAVVGAGLMFLFITLICKALGG